MTSEKPVVSYEECNKQGVIFSLANRLGVSFDTEVNPHGVVLLKVYPDNPHRRFVESARGVERIIPVTQE